MIYLTRKECNQAIELTKEHLFKLEYEIGREEFLGIFDDYSPLCEDYPPDYLLETLFGRDWCFGKFRDEYTMSEDYIMSVWKRYNNLYKMLNVRNKYNKPSKKQIPQAGYRNFRRQIFERDNYVCQECGTNKKLCAHHIKPRKEFPELFLEKNNVITLCSACHAKKHPRLSKLIKSQRRK